MASFFARRHPARNRRRCSRTAAALDVDVQTHPKGRTALALQLAHPVGIVGIMVRQQKRSVLGPPTKGVGVTPFEFLSVALSFVIGLGITYLLTSLLSLIRERRRCRPDWLALLWAFYVFGYQVQYWWAVFELSEVETWSLKVFLALFFYAVLLFTAGGLVLPHDAARHEEGLRAYFERDGRLGVLLLNVYFLIAPLFNARLFDTPLAEPLNVSIVAMGLFGLSFHFLESRRLQIGHTIVWGIVAATLFFRMSAAAY